ncbi:hypothetical protein L1887_57711 [Cichorium endivia]|nr:hypothetical protein L1887_57711 [Cichorium endivia]
MCTDGARTLLGEGGAGGRALCEGMGVAVLDGRCGLEHARARPKLCVDRTLTPLCLVHHPCSKQPRFFPQPPQHTPSRPCGLFAHRDFLHHRLALLTARFSPRAASSSLPTVRVFSPGLDASFTAQSSRLPTPFQACSHGHRFLSHKPLLASSHSLARASYLPTPRSRQPLDLR